MTATAIGAPHAAPRRRRNTGKIIRETLFYLAVAIVVLISLFPFYWILRTSLLSNYQVSQGVGGANGVIPSHLSFSAWKNVFTQNGFLTPLRNSLIVALACTAVTVVVASMAGYALARLKIRGVALILGFILLAGSSRCWP